MGMSFDQLYYSYIIGDEALPKVYNSDEITGDPVKS